MPSLQVQTVIRRPVTVVVEALMNPDNMVYWTRYLERFEVVSGTPGQPGAVGRLHYLQGGKRFEMEDRLVEADAGRSYLSHVSGDVIEAKVETTLREIGGDTEMTVRWTGRAKTFPLKLLLPFLKAAMRRQSQAELEEFRRLVETRGSRFAPARESATGGSGQPKFS